MLTAPVVGLQRQNIISLSLSLPSAPPRFQRREGSSPVADKYQLFEKVGRYLQRQRLSLSSAAAILQRLPNLGPSFLKVGFLKPGPPL